MRKLARFLDLRGTAGVADDVKVGFCAGVADQRLRLAIVGVVHVAVCAFILSSRGDLRSNFRFDLNANVAFGDSDVFTGNPD